MDQTTKPQLDTPRILLRAVRAEDAADLVLLDSDPEVRRYVGQFPPPTIEQVREALIPRWHAIDSRTPEVGFWIAELRDDASFVGWFHLRPPREDEPALPGDLSLGYRLRRERWGKGLATEGGQALLRYGFERLGAPRVTASALRENIASIRVMQKLGMTLDREWVWNRTEPAVLYALHKNSPAARKLS